MNRILEFLITLLIAPVFLIAMLLFVIVSVIATIIVIAFCVAAFSVLVIGGAWLLSVTAMAWLWEKMVDLWK